MRITLDWAMRQSSAEAGLIGMLEEGQLQVVAQAGFGEVGETAVEQSLALSLPGFQSAVDTALPQRTDFASGGGRGFLPASDHQIIVPIRREAEAKRDCRSDRKRSNGGRRIRRDGRRAHRRGRRGG